MQITVDYTHLPFDRLLVYCTMQVWFGPGLCVCPDLIRTIIIAFAHRVESLES